MKMRKSFLIIGLLIILVLVACNNKKSNSEGTVESSKEGNTEGEISQGVTEDEILIGTLGPQSGNLAQYDTMRQGLQAYVNYVNEKGDIHGRKLKLIAYDDQYQPAKTVPLAKRLVETDKVFAIVIPSGSAPNLAAQKYYERMGIPVIMAATGTSKLVNPPNQAFFGTATTNYTIEAKILLEYAVKQLGAQTISVVYQNDDLGLEGLKTMKEDVDNYGNVKIVAEIPYVSGNVDFSSHAQHVVKANADVTISLSAATPATNLKKELYKLGYNNKPFIVSQVGGNDKHLFELAGEDLWEGTISTAPILMYDVSDDPSVEDFLKQMEKDFPGKPIAGFTQLGWGAGQVFVEALERTGPDLTWENLKDALYTFDNWDGSMNASVTFSPNNHYGINSLYITEARDGKIVPISGKYSFNPETGEISYQEK